MVAAGMDGDDDTGRVDVADTVDGVAEDILPAIGLSTARLDRVAKTTDAISFTFC